MHMPIYCLQTTSLLCAIPAMEIPTMNESLLPRLRIPHGHIQCVCGCMSALTNVTTDSQIVPFTFISTGSPLDLTCM